jgi:hypothetical protein
MPDLQQREYTSQSSYPGTTAAASERAAPSFEREERRSMEVVGGGSALEALAGAGTVVLTIVGLSTGGTLAFYLMTIAIIVVGAGLILHGSSWAVRIRELMTGTAENRGEEAEWGTGVTVEVLAGVAGIALGILALVGLMPMVLSAVALIVFGSALLLSSGTVAEMNDLRLARARVGSSARQVTRRTTVGAAAIQGLTGIAAGVLGILAVLGVFPATLTLVGLLCIGGGLLISGGAVSSRIMMFLARSW